MIIRGYGRDKTLKLGGKVSGSGQIIIEGDVVIGSLYLSNNLKLGGNLHVLRDFEIKGNVILQKGGSLTVDGKRTIHGALKEE